MDEVELAIGAQHLRSHHQHFS